MLLSDSLKPCILKVWFKTDLDPKQGYVGSSSGPCSTVFDTFWFEEVGHLSGLERV